MSKLNAVFMGTPEFCLPTLQILRSHPDIHLQYIVSMPDRKSGRGQKVQSPPVVQFAQSHKIPCFQTANINQEIEFLESLEAKNIDVIIVLAFAQFLGQKVLSLPKSACYNIHTSLLPKYRGAAPIQYALLNGDEKTGVSIQEMVKQMDAGDIVHSDTVKIHPRETGESLFTKLSYQAGLSCFHFIQNLKSGNIVKTPQKKEGLSFAPTISKGMGQLLFQESSADQIERQVRALYPWPGTYTFLNHKRLKVFNVQLSPRELKPGELLILRNGEVHVGTKTSALRLSHIQLEGKKPGLDTDFFKAAQKKDLYRITDKEPS